MNKPESIPMLRRVYAVRDDKQNEYNTPVLIPNDAVASRSFGDMISTDKNSLIAQHQKCQETTENNLRGAEQ